MRIIVALMMVVPFFAGACAAGGMGGMGGCGMGGHEGHGTASQASHAQEVKGVRPAPDPGFDAARTRRVLDAYDSIVVALAGDKTSGVAEAAALIVKDAPNDAIKEAAGSLSVADKKADIAGVRERFKALSASVVLYAAGNHESLEAAIERDKAPMPRKAYCPMVETAWLQHGEKITNPFYGSSMLRCGEFQNLAEAK